MAARAELRITTALSSDSVYVGDAVMLRLRIEDAPANASVNVPESADFTIELAGGPISQTSINIVNGRMQRDSYVEYRYRLTPRRAGNLTVPPFSVTDAGRTVSSAAIAVEVLEPQKQDIVFLELSTDRSDYYIDQSFRIVLRIWVRKLTLDGKAMDVEPLYPRDPPMLTIPWLTELSGCEPEDLNEFARRYNASSSGTGFAINGLATQDGFMLMDRELAKFKFFSEQLQRDGLDGQVQDYYVYTMSQKFRPTTPGALDIAPVRLKGDFPLEVDRRGRPLRNETVVVLSNALELTIKDPPLDGRPASYTGAIGAVSLDVAAKPTEVNAGDPITLQIKITGDARLESVGPPPLAENAELARSFKVPEDPTAGTVSGRTKTFTQSIRPNSEDVTAIPPIELSYFDTEMGRYVTLASEPIPIVVHPASQLPLDAVVGAAPAPINNELTVSGEGILANVTDPDRLLARRSSTLGVGWYLAAGASPLLFALLWGWQTWRRRVHGDVATARRRRASRRAHERLASAASAADPAGAARHVAESLLHYMADRMNAPGGGMTKDDALARLASVGVNGTVRDELADVLSQCELATFAGTASETDGLVERARTCLDRLERVRLR